MPTCTNCGTEKEPERFPKDRRYRSGLGSWCKPCKNKIGYEQIKADPVAIKAKRDRAYQNRIKKPGAKEANRKAQFRYRYGLEIEDYHALAQAQDGKCAICSTQPPRLFVDHCHETGLVRGLLCPNCNKAIGLLADDVGRILAAATYLQKGRHNAGEFPTS